MTQDIFRIVSGHKGVRAFYLVTHGGTLGERGLIDLFKDAGTIEVTPTTKKPDGFTFFI